MNPASLPEVFSETVESIRGIGGRRALLFHKLEIHTIYDLVAFFPRAYEDWTSPMTIGGLQHGEEQAFVASVSRKPSVLRKGRFSLLRTVLRDETGAIAAVWFNQPYLEGKLIKGESYLFRGKIRRNGGTFEVQNPAFELYDPEKAVGVVSVYPLTRGLTQGVLRTAAAAALDRVEGQIPEPLPPWIRREFRLCEVAYAYRMIHQPESAEAFAIARRRLAFEEMFLVQAGLRMIKGRLRGMAHGIPMPADALSMRQMAEMEAALPYALTAAQKRAVGEILAEMARGFPMNRMLQGDVGSGKTVVAAMALYRAAMNGCQGALMAPTSILAEQHERTLRAFFSGMGGLPSLRVELLTGATRAADRRRILSGLADGSVQILIGTHALIEDRVRFSRLGLAVTDEQHRFGVRQRTGLTIAPAGNAEPASGAPAESPHVLVMSATPIPRSLALMLYGDLDLSVLDELPAGRNPIETYAAGSADRERIYQILRHQVEKGRQVYVVCPMISENDEGTDTGLETAEVTYRRFAEEVFPDLRVGLLHGALKAPDKTSVMCAFLDGDLDILVSTTVIEVGVDNPNASVMVVENAERFGLSQLHQLRGRIGRGPYRSICILVSDAGESIAKERIRTLCLVSDGFKIAEKDLELRGPGDFFGTRQHGIPDFRIANLYEDTALLGEVSACLDRLMEADPYLESPDNRSLIPAIRLHFGDAFPSIGI